MPESFKTSESLFTLTKTTRYFEINPERLVGKNLLNCVNRKFILDKNTFEVTNRPNSFHRYCGVLCAVTRFLETPYISPKSGIDLLSGCR